jgi:hypothetical protein
LAFDFVLIPLLNRISGFLLNESKHSDLGDRIGSRFCVLERSSGCPCFWELSANKMSVPPFYH